MVSAVRFQRLVRVAVVGLGAISALRGVAQTPYALPYTINVVAGGGTVCAAAADAFGDGCPAKQAVFNSVLLGLGVNARGDVFIADTSNNLIRKVDANTGIITVYAGSTSSTVCASALDRYGDGCPASDGLASVGGKYTYLGKPYALAVAKNGDVYFTAGTSVVQKVSAATGMMTLVAGLTAPAASKSGTAVSGYTGDGGPANQAEINLPRGVTVDAANDVFLADYTNNVVRVVYGGGAAAAAQITAANPAVTSPVVGNIYTICGSHSGTAGTTGDNGPASAALLSGPSDVAVDGYGNLFILDQSKEIRMIYAGGNVMGLTSPTVGTLYRVAGGGTVKGTTLTAIPGTTAAMSTVRRVITDSRGNLYISDQNEIIWFVDATTGWMRPIAGVYKGSGLPTGCPQQTDTLGNNCPATVAQIHVGSEGYGIAADADGNLFVTDPGALTIRKVSSNLIFPATAGAETQSVEVHYPAGSAQGTLALGNPDYTAGTATCTINGDLTQDCVVLFTFTPTVPGADDTVVTTTDTLGKVGTLGLAGAGVLPSLALDPGGATSIASGLNKPASVVSDGNGNLLIADTANHRVLKYNVAAKTQVVLAGNGTAGYAGDGAVATAATLRSPGAVAVAKDGTVYVADTGNNVVRRIDAATGVITTYAGGASAVCAAASDAVGDGCAGTQALFAAPSGLVVSPAGLLYVADTGDNRVRVVTPNGANVMTVVGAGTVCAIATDAVGDGCVALQATLAMPTQLRMDAAGNLYVADTGNNLVRRMAPATQVITAVAGNGQTGGGGDGGLATSAQLSGPQGIAVDGAGSVYIADVGNSAVRLVSAATGVITTVAGFNGTAGSGTLPGVATATQLKGPAGVEVTGTGTLYVMDTGNSRGLSVARNAVSFNFGKVNITQSSAVQTVLVTNTGSAGAALGTPFVTGTGSTSQLTLVPATTNGCSAAQALAPGAQCALSVQFTPTANGAETATYSFAGSTGVNVPVPSVVLTGTGATLVSTSSVTLQTTPASGNPQYGQTVVVTVTVTPGAQASNAISGTVTLQVDSVGQAPVNVSVDAQGNGVAVITLPKLSVGAHTIAASFSGDDNYGGSTAQPLTITVTKSATSVTETAAPTAVVQFQSVTFTATVAAQTGGVPTGTVTFLNGSMVLGTGSVGVTGLATFSSATLPVGTYQVVAQYGGDGNFAASSSTALTFVVSPDPPDYTLSGSTAALTVAQGGVIQTSVTITPTNTLNGTVKFNCTGLPVNAYCTFLPQTLAFTPATDQATTVQVTLWTNIGPGTVPGQASLRGTRETMWFALLGPLGLLMLRKRVVVRRFAIAVLLLAADMSFTACSTNLPPATALTPAGTSTVTLQASGPDTQSHAVPLTLTVVSAK